MSLDIKDWSNAGLGALAGVIIKGGFDWFSSRGTSAAAVQSAINESMKTIMDQMHAQHAECQSTLTAARNEMEVLRGDFKQAQQYISSLVSILRREGLNIPKNILVETVFILDSQQEKAPDA